MMSKKTLYTWLIYFILPALYGSGRPLWAPLMVLTRLYASSHPLWPLPWNSWCSRDAGISNDDSNMVKCTTPSSADRFCMDLRDDRSTTAAITVQVTFRDTGRLLRGESFTFLYINTLFPTLKEMLSTDMAYQLAAEMVPSPDSLSDLCCFYASKHLLPNSPQWTNCT